MTERLSNKVISRLTLYHCVLVDYIEQGIEYVSSMKLSHLLSIDDSQIRKDIKLLEYGIKGEIIYGNCTKLSCGVCLFGNQRGNKS